MCPRTAAACKEETQKKKKDKGAANKTQNETRKQGILVEGEGQRKSVSYSQGRMSQ